MVQVFKDLLAVGCKFLSIGQYLAPSGDYEKVIEFVKPEQFARYEKLAYDLEIICQNRLCRIYLFRPSPYTYELHSEIKEEKSPAATERTPHPLPHRQMII